MTRTGTMWSRGFAATAVSLCLIPLALVRAEPYNITIYDESPTITYLPSRSGDSSTTWNSSYTISGSYNNESGQMGEGESYHYTTADGASASLGFVGTAVYVWGNNYGNESDVQLKVGEHDLERGQVEGMLGWKDGLENQWWDFTVNITSGSAAWNGFDLRRITVTVDFGGQGAYFENTTLPTLDDNDDPNSQISFSGSWTTGTEAGLLPYNRVDTYGQDARIFIPTLGRTTLVVVYGSVNDDHGSYFFSASELAPGWPSTQWFNGSSPWIAINQVIYFGVVTGGQLLGQNLEGGMWFDVSRVDFVDAFGGSFPKKVNAGAIAGGVVGGPAGLALILVAFWFFFWRRRKNKPEYYKSGRSYSDGFEIDPNNENGHTKPVNEADDVEMTCLRTATSNNELDSTSAPGGPTPITVHAAESENPPSTPDNPVITPYSPPPTIAPAPAPESATALAPSSANGTQRSHDRLTLVSPDLDNEVPPVPALPPTTAAESSRKARRQQREAAQAAAAQTGSGFVQETDAGRVAILPPSYDPAWAQEGLPNVSSPMGSPTELEAEPPVDQREGDLSPTYDPMSLGATIGSDGDHTPIPTTTDDRPTHPQEDDDRPESTTPTLPNHHA